MAANPLDRIVDLEDQIDGLRELLAAAIGDRDRARTCAVQLEQECAALENALRAATHPYEAATAYWKACKHCLEGVASTLHLTPERVRTGTEAAPG